MTAQPALDPAILHFYQSRYSEDGRLRRTAHGQLEYLRTRELLERYLPADGGRVLDIGGATGVHARWLAESGYEVQLLDPVPSHVELAGAITGVTATVGDARALPFADAESDATLLLGPLYHLTDPAERALALREAVRVTRPGGLVAVAAISRYAGLLELAAIGGIDDAAESELVAALRTGINHDDPAGFTNAYFHLPDELADELGTAGLGGVTVFGVEGPSTPALDQVPLAELARVLPSALRSARLLECDPLLIAASPHLLAVGRVLA